MYEFVQKNGVGEKFLLKVGNILLLGDIDIVFFDFICKVFRLFLV